MVFFFSFFLKRGRRSSSELGARSDPLRWPTPYRNSWHGIAPWRSGDAPGRAAVFCGVPVGIPTTFETVVDWVSPISGIPLELEHAPQNGAPDRFGRGEMMWNGISNQGLGSPDCLDFYSNMVSQGLGKSLYIIRRHIV